ncbi:putative chromatin assembly protein [Diaporthe ampelina]|uniref:Putative chromatin assembly protein n=1 Tax=Diaporthe ampelina TaxID=1214573 RepID=A0A0G2FYF8_9PEZI|nr:putative chromatin assembly protein [Diaporthe ampelina]
MVLFKRKPVQFLQPPPVENDHEVWYIPQTGEVFVTYEDYLNRLDFYKQKRFICQITGHSGLNFFEALESELAGAQEVEQAFPEPLKGPILRRVQFQTISRIDNLVDKLYEEFKGDFYPGEHVTVSIHTGERFTGVVRDKARFGSKMLPDGTLTVPFSRYFVSLDDSEEHEAVVDDNNIWRDRKVFTKSVLRSFVKKTVTRDAWTGAPWLVKDTIAAQFKIDTRIPTHLRYETKVQERKQAQSQKRLSNQMSHPQDVSGMANSFQTQGPVRLPELKPATRPPKASKNQNHHGHHGQVVKKPEPGQFVHLPLPGNPFQFPLSFRHNQVPPPPPVYAQPEPPPPPPPPPKYPIEDLKVEPTHLVRPPIRYMCSDPPVEVEEQSASCENILMKSIGPLLEAWDTLNVYCEIFQLDSFTFDDFLEAMQVASEETKVQLFDEIHCAVLKILVDSDTEGGKINFRLPELDSDEDSDEDDDEEDGEDESREPTPQPTARATRSSMAKMEADRLAAEAAAAEREERQLENAPKHRAEELLADYDWIDHLRKRDFKDGGWETIMVGLLYQLSKEERRKAACEDLLIQLVPRDVEATQDTIRQHYAAMDVNYRAQALQIICLLTAETKAIRGYMEDCSEHMTGFRKDKIEWQRQRKQAIEELKALNEERKILLPENLPPSPAHEAVDANGDAKMDDVDELTPAEDEAADMEDEPPRSVARGLRRGQDRAAERQRQKEREEEKRKEAEAAKAVPKQSKQFVKVLKEIQKKEDLIKKCEEEIAVIDNDLREADCARTRVLGKDRFWNRYYWFERNGMPYGGLPNSSTADAGYANGCIWIQGPDDLEREGYIELAPEWQKEYQAIFNMTVPERKAKEEGPTSVFTARQWGYIDDPKDVKKLIDWLDPRGFNELKLRKELVNFSDRILKHMENRQAYLAANEAEAKAAEEEREKETKTNGTTGKRMTTRTRNAATPEPTPQYRCLQWENTTAIEELGHLHSDQPPPAPPKPKKGGSRKKDAAKEVAGEPVPAVKTRSRRR